MAKLTRNFRYIKRASEQEHKDIFNLLEEARQFSKQDGRPNERWEIVRTVTGYSMACKYELVDTFYSVGYFVKCDNCGHVTVFDAPDSEHLGNDVCAFCYTKLRSL